MPDMSPENPQITVIIPVYNRPKLLREAAESVFAQSFTDYELIIVDDGSTDETPAAAASLCESAAVGGRCRVITTPRTGFPGAARNRGAEQARGSFLAFLDSDDTWLPRKLELQYEMMQESGCRISHTREIWRRGDKIVSQKGQRHKRQGDIFADALKKCIIGPSTVMMERGLFFETGGFHEKIEIAEDYEYWLRITSGFEVGYVHESLTHKRAGGWPQLSEKYGKIEWFRLCALASLLEIPVPGFSVQQKFISGYSWPGFDEEHRAAALSELKFKCGVWSAGCRKRGRSAEADKIEKIISLRLFQNYESFARSSV